MAQVSRFPGQRRLSERHAYRFLRYGGEVRHAFQAEIHQLEVRGKRHFANATEPTIPSALAPVISGVVSLHNFRPHPMYQMRKARTEFTFTDIFGNDHYAVVPADLAKDLQPESAL